MGVIANKLKDNTQLYFLLIASAGHFWSSVDKHTYFKCERLL